MRSAHDPMSAASVAKEALTSEQTARKHLRSLVEHGFVEETAAPESTATLYRRSTDSLALERAHRILEGTDLETLSDRVLAMREELQAYSDRTGANSPEAAVRAEADVDAETLLEWRTTRRNLAFAEVALALSSVEDVTDTARAV